MDLFKGDPDLIIMASNFWDLSRMVLKEKIDISNGLSPDAIEGYERNLTTWIHHVRETFSNQSHLVFHTHPQPAPEAYKQKWDYLPWHQLNEAGRLVAEKEGLELVDYDRITRPFPPEKWSKDGLHPFDWVSQEILNVYLNIAVRTAASK